MCSSTKYLYPPPLWRFSQSHWPHPTRNSNPSVGCREGSMEKFWNCTFCITVLLPITGESLVELDLLEHLLQFELCSSTKYLYLPHPSGDSHRTTGLTLQEILIPPLVWREGRKEKFWNCTFCITVLLPPTGESLVELDLLEHLLQFDCEY